MNTAGSAPLDSALYKQALEGLTKGYGDRFSDAMNYNKYVKGTESSQFSDNMRNLQNLLSLQQRYLSSAADWGQKMGSPPPVSPNPDDSQDRALKDLTLERQRRQMEMETWQNAAAKEDRRRALEEKLTSESKWTQLMQKAGRVFSNWNLRRRLDRARRGYGGFNGCSDGLSVALAAKIER